MKVTTKVRLILFVVITVVVAGFFFFEPALNIGTNRALSMFQEIKQGQPILPILAKWSIISIAVFLGLFFLIGLEEKPDLKEKENKTLNKEEFKEESNKEEQEKK